MLQISGILFLELQKETGYNEASVPGTAETKKKRRARHGKRNEAGRCDRRGKE